MTKTTILSKRQIVSMSDEWYSLSSGNHFWMQWRFEIIAKLLEPHLDRSSKVLEIGCGNGIVMKQFENRFNINVDGCDLNSFAIDHLVPGLGGKVYLYDIHDRNPLLVNQYDVVFLLDVIEHIDQVEEFFESALCHLKTNGILVINVPAHQSLYSKYDEVVGHKRRYGTRKLQEHFKHLNVDVINMSFWGLFLLPILFVRKYYLQIFSPKSIVQKGFEPPNSFINKIFIILMKIEMGLFSTPLSGTSLLAIVRKK